MRKKILTIIIGCIFCLSCQKNTLTLYRAKIVSIGCGVIVADIQGNNTIGTSYTSAGVTYNNAVTINDYCYMMDKNVRQGNTISFVITPTQTASASNCAIPACVTLLAIFYPVKSIYVNAVQVIN